MRSCPGRAKAQAVVVDASDAPRDALVLAVSLEGGFADIAELQQEAVGFIAEHGIGSRNSPSSSPRRCRFFDFIDFFSMEFFQASAAGATHDPGGSFIR